jgi:urease accessory protein
MATTTDRQLLDLMTWLSPSFPVGGYAYSHGIEYAVENARISNEHDLAGWINAALIQGAGRLDGIFFVATWQAITEQDNDRFGWVIERQDVMRGTSELALEGSAQGQAFLDTIAQTRNFLRLEDLLALIRSSERRVTYAVAVAIVAALAEVPLRAALLAYYHAFAANLISAGVRLVPLGQIAGQRMQEKLKPVIEQATEAALCGDIEYIGTAAPLIDWASMKHETQYTRLFRS